jgi:hypothetical protein
VPVCDVVVLIEFVDSHDRRHSSFSASRFF